VSEDEAGLPAKGRSALDEWQEAEAAYRPRFRAAARVYGRWRARDEGARPWAHAWRAGLPALEAHVRGAVVEAVRASSGAWDEHGSRDVLLELRTPDGRELHLYLGLEAVGGPDASGPVRSADEEWGYEQASLGTALGLALFDEREDPSVRGDERPALPEWGGDGTLEVVVPSQDPWYLEDGVEAQIVAEVGREGAPETGEAGEAGAC
jgi:hypothetical protein